VSHALQSLTIGLAAGSSLMAHLAIHWAKAAVPSLVLSASHLLKLKCGVCADFDLMRSLFRCECVTSCRVCCFSSLFFRLLQVACCNLLAQHVFFHETITKLDMQPEATVVLATMIPLRLIRGFKLRDLTDPGIHRFHKVIRSYYQSTRIGLALRE
jgi:hypothetical protein